jgi:hypothetical protein
MNIESIVPPSGPAGPFPPRGAGAFPSSGNVDLWWHEPKANEVFDPATRRHSSYHFYGGDSMTVVWRSDPVVTGSHADIFGVPVGPAGSEITVSRSDIRELPQLPIDPNAGAGTRRRIYAELHEVRMRGDGCEFLVGEPFRRHLIDDLKLPPEQVAAVFRRSYGEVIPWDLSGDPARDFPADNHFNVFFALKYDATPEHPSYTVFNKDPVVVVDLGLSQLPPLGRVTIPQFPHDMPALWHIDDPEPQPSVPPRPPGTVLAGRGGCCAHSVRGLQAIGDLTPRFISYAELSADVPEARSQFALRGASFKPRSVVLARQSQFRSVHSRYIDGLFVPNKLTQISTSGLLFHFEDTTTGAITEALHEARGERGIRIDPPTDAPAYAGPQQHGIILGANAGLTIKLGELRKANPDFYLVTMVAVLGLNADSPAGSAVRLRVLVDGIEMHFATRVFDTPGASQPVSIDLQTAREYLTIVATSTTGSPTGVMAFFELRGFGKLAADTLPAYQGSRTPRR